MHNDATASVIQWLELVTLVVAPTHLERITLL